MDKKIVLFDGAFGTYYYAKYGSEKACEEANVENPERVFNIHKEYIAAGADAVKTNTFGAANMLARGNDVFKIVSEGYKIAKKAAGEKVRVFADIGAINCEFPVAESEIYVKLTEQFLNLGADAFIFETMPDFYSLASALELIKNTNKSAVVAVSFAASHDGYTKKGCYFEKLAEQAQNNENVDILGLNCVCGPGHMAGLVKKLRGIEKPLLIMPNAGYPVSHFGRAEFSPNADYFAEKMLEIRDLGAEILGGCCGTTPMHIKKTAELILKNPQKKVKTANITVKEKTGVKTEEKKRSEKITAAELDPPKNADAAFVTAAANAVFEAGADIVTLTDSPLAKARADSVITAAKIQRETGASAMPHITCRDKNHIALKGAVLGGYFEGIRNILAITGDPVSEDRLSGMRGIFSFNSFGLISFIKTLNEQEFADDPITIWAALNINAPNFDKELKRAEKKLGFGAQRLVTQAVFSEKAKENLKKAKESLNAEILAGIMPVASYKNAVFLNNEVSGIELDEAFMKSLENETPESVRSLSISYCTKIMQSIKSCCDGYYIMTPLKRADMTVEIVKAARRL